MSNTYVESKEEANKVLQSCMTTQPKVIAFDTETTGLNWDMSEAFLIQVGWGMEDNYAFTRPYFPYVKKILEDKTSHKVAHNLKFDKHFCENEGIVVQGTLHDTVAMARLLFPASVSLSFDTLATSLVDKRATEPEKALKKWMGAEKRRRSHILTNALKEAGHTRKAYDALLKEGALTDDLLEIANQHPLEVSYADVPKEIMEPYATGDTKLLLPLFYKLGEKIRRNGLLDVYQRDMRTMLYVYNWERTGVETDLNYLKEGVAYGEKKIKELEKTIHMIAGEPVNSSSPKQLKELFEKRGFSLASTDEGHLKTIKEEDELAEKILEYRGYSKMIGTYFRPILKKAGSNNGRLHGGFNVSGPVTGRFSSSNPNLQNIPKEFEDSKLLVRKSIVPTKDHTFVFQDYSMMEVRIMAEYSKDKNLVKAILNGEDLHTNTALAIDARAREIYVEGLHKDAQPAEFQKIRGHAKRTTFGIFYGIGAGKLSKQLGVDVATARQYVENFFKLYPGVYNFIQNVQNTARMRPGCWVRNKYGRVYWGEENREYALVDYLIQGTGADMIKIAIDRCEKILAKAKSRLVLMIHDELVFEIHKDEKHLVKELHEAMTDFPEFNIPIEVDIEYSDTTWLDKKPYSLVN